jgi:transglutaminase-like putative cysteine protease
LAIILIATTLRPNKPVSAGDEWQPISPEELKMTSVPEAPGAPAIYLYRQVDRNDQEAHEYNYLRVKILTDEGRRQADVEIPFLKGEANIHGIKARTIRPDGSIANFDGKVYEKTIVKARGVKFLAKTFTLPDVQAGSIIEYHYMRDWDQGIYFREAHWILAEELYTRVAKFSLKPISSLVIRWSWPLGLPPGTDPPKDEHGSVHMETHNIPAFQIEDYMPPENELKMRVDFVYSEGNDEKEPEKFWKKEGKTQNDRVENFVGKRKAMEQAVAQIVGANDSPEVKLQKIYARVQQIRNISFEAEKTEQEQKREKMREINNVEDLWKNGYGSGRQITWLFLGLARAAGLEAYPVLVSRRDQYFFKPNLMNTGQLNDNVVLVKVNGTELYFDPGTPFTPYGLLPWSETGVTGLRLDKDGGSWIKTSLPAGSDSMIDRKASLKLTDTGALEGKITVTYTGLEALGKRLEERNEDDTNRKKYLEDQVKESIPVGIDVELTNKPDWQSSSRPLVAEFDLKVPGWVSGAGRRALMPVGLFGGMEKRVFEHANRTHPIYFPFPSERADDLTIDLPLGWQVNNIPSVQGVDAKAAVYKTNIENNKGTLHMTRRVNLDLLMVDSKLYSTLRAFFQAVKTGDEQQIVLQPGATASSN